MLGGIAGAMGGTAGLITTILSGFSKPGLPSDDAEKFVPLILQFLQTKVGPDTIKKLRDTLKA